ncbi:hypothetical protein GCM10009623_09840 [Nocardioides aestuarii]
MLGSLVAGLGWFGLSATVISGLPQVPGVAVALLGADIVLVVVLARRLDLPIAITVGVASAVALDWYAIPPTHRNLMPDASNTLALGSYLLMGSLLGELAVRARQRAVDAESARLELEGEQAALRRVATLVARETPSAEVFARVTEEVGRILGVDLALMLRYETDATATVVASWSNDLPWLASGTRLVPDGDSIAARVRDTGTSAAIADFAQVTGELAEVLRGYGVRASVGSPIMVAGGVWGALVAASTTRSLPDDGGSRLSEFTELVASAVANAHSRTELNDSRRRIVAAGDEARRLIERDLHDGVQQRLVSLALGVRLVRDLVRDGEDARAHLEAIESELTGTMEELRELSHGIHPAILSEGGLRPAVAALARRSALPVEVVVSGTAHRAPAEVEVAVYFVAAETLSNVAKHAAASSVRLELALEPHHALLVVTDDGRGGADLGAGTGLVGLADRVHALGGDLELSSPRGQGTTLRVRVPWVGQPGDAVQDQPEGST